MERYELIDGRIVILEESEYPDFQGGTRTVLTFHYDNGQMAVYTDCLRLMKPADREEVEEWISQLTD